MEIIPMESHHWPEVENIYLAGVETRLATFETQSPGWEKWDRGHHAFCRFVAVDGGQVCGWIALSPVSARHVYRGVAEVSIYIGGQSRGKGIGKALFQHLLKDCGKHGIWMLQSVLFPENEASVGLHRKLGFRKVGHRERIAQLDGIWRNTVMYELRLPDPSFGEPMDDI